MVTNGLKCNPPDFKLSPYGVMLNFVSLFFFFFFFFFFLCVLFIALKLDSNLSLHHVSVFLLLFNLPRKHLNLEGYIF